MALFISYEGALTFEDRLLGTRVPPLEARGRVPRTLAPELQVLGRLFCSAHSTP